MNPPPPGPKGLSSIAFLQAGLAPPLHVLKRLTSRYGDPFRVRYVSGPVTFIGEPEALRTVYSADPSRFAVWGLPVIEPVFGRTSVVVSSGERHRRDRKLLTPAFNGCSMRAYAVTMARQAEEVAGRWPVGRPFPMLASTQAITLDIMVRVVFGVRTDERIAMTRAAVLELIDSLHPLIFLFPFLRRPFAGVGPWARNQRAVAALNALLRQEIRAREQEGAAGDDILSLMMSARHDDGAAMGEEELLDHLRGLLFAGHEATATALAWCLYWLHREPALRARVLDEIDALGPDPDPHAFASLPFLEAVCHEVLRLYPPVVDPARIAKEPFDVAGYTIPAGEALRASLTLLHSRPELYPEPERFRPERFLERKYTQFEYIPFGGGARRCLGAAFAMYELKVLLGTLLGQNRLRLARAAPVVHVRRGLTMGPSGGVPMVLEGRRAAGRRAHAAEARQ
jgi:cytochrome P450